MKQSLFLFTSAFLVAARGQRLGFWTPPWVNPCDTAPLNGTDACDTTLSFRARARSMVGLLRSDEKAGLLSNSDVGVPRLGIAGYEWWNEALHGVASSPGVQLSWKPATSFPQVITTASSFNTSLFHALGVAVGTEARAFFNARRSGLTFWAPNINIFRDPRWGRGQETPGEDPVLTAAYAANFPKGMQGEHGKFLRVSSCCKHYAGYSLEHWEGADRDHFDAVVDARDLQDTYLPAFQSCVQRSRASGVMCSYNAVNGVPSCASTDLLSKRLRGDWGFDGYVTGDCGAVEDILIRHNFSSTATAAVVAALSAGLDTDCGVFLKTYVPHCINEGSCPPSLLDPALENLFAVRMRLGMFDPPSAQPYANIGEDSVDSGFHRELALEAARQGMVLLKNVNRSLPLNPNTVSRILLVGPHVNATQALLGNYFGQPPFIISPLDGIEGYGVHASFVLGCESVECANTTGFPEAVRRAKVAESVVLVVGIDNDSPSGESEGKDRNSIFLPGMQHALVRVVAQAAIKPVTVVVLGGGAVDLSAEKANPKVGSILWAGYPGQSGGKAIADTIFGENNPSGRLPQTFYSATLTTSVSLFDMAMRPNSETGNPGRTYRFFTGTPVYEFGYGLSYSRFEYRWRDQMGALTSRPPPISVVDATAAQKIAKEHKHDLLTLDLLAPIVQYSVFVSNHGPTGAEVILVYVRPPAGVAGVNGVPIKSLRYFTRVTIQSDENATVDIVLRPQDFQVPNGADGALGIPFGDWKVEIGQRSGNYLTMPHLEHTVRMVGGPASNLGLSPSAEATQSSE